ncbi:MAG: SPFH domain-containing protein [Euryarchaeota archaeon]|nr:SPFH domain-containing protein [Euryarchaeota archaeon]
MPLPPATFLAIIAVVLIFLFLLWSSIKVLREYERGVVFRLGRLIGAKGPGIFFLIPIVDRMVKVDLRTFVIDVPSQDAITRDNVPVKVNAVVYARAFDPNKAVTQIENYTYGTSMMSQTTLRSVIGHAVLDELLAEREKVNKRLQEIIDMATDPWGIKVSAVEVKDVVIPEGMYRAMARQAEAERERRARVIMAEAEAQAAEKLSEAAKVLNTDPITLRYLQTMLEVAAEKNVTILFPIEMLRFFQPSSRTEEKK